MGIECVYPSPIDLLPFWGCHPEMSLLCSPPSAERAIASRVTQVLTVVARAIKMPLKYLLPVPALIPGSIPRVGGGGEGREEEHKASEIITRHEFGSSRG